MHPADPDWNRLERTPDDYLVHHCSGKASAICGKYPKLAGDLIWHNKAIAAVHEQLHQPVGCVKWAVFADARLEFCIEQPVFAQFIFGYGVGGEYPMAAGSAAERAEAGGRKTASKRGREVIF